MNPDIRIEISFKGHRKRRKLQTLLGQGSTDYLIDLWIGSALSRPEGILHGYDVLDIAMEAGWAGDPQQFVNALVEVGFLDIIDNGTYALHDWAEHQPFVVKTKEREEHARKAGNARWSKHNSRTGNTRCIRGESPENPQHIPGACSEHSQSIKEASSENARCMRGASSEHSQGMPGGERENPQCIPEAFSGHARCNAPIPIPIPILSNIEVKDISESILSASAPDGAVHDHLLTAGEIPVPGEEVPLQERNPETCSAQTIECDGKSSGDLVGSSGEGAVIPLSEEGAAPSRTTPFSQKLPSYDAIGRSSESNPYSTIHPDPGAPKSRLFEPPADTLKQNEVKEEATREIYDLGHETARDPPDTVAKSPGAAERPTVYLSKRKRKLSGWKLEAFEEFWKAFGYKKGRAEAADAWLDIPNLTSELAAKIIEAAGKEARARPALKAEGISPKWAQGWISGRRWEDWEEDSEAARKQENASSREEHHAAEESLSRGEEESRYRKSIGEALRKFM